MLRLLISLALAVCSLPTAEQAAAQRSSVAGGNAEKFWPSWRGPHNTGVSPTAKPPAEWSETKNVRWKIELPGRGAATPIVWGNNVYVLSGYRPTAQPARAASTASW